MYYYYCFSFCSSIAGWYQFVWKKWKKHRAVMLQVDGVQQKRFVHLIYTRDTPKGTFHSTFCHYLRLGRRLNS
jgi:hypothetical protein